MASVRLLLPVSSSVGNFGLSKGQVVRHTKDGFAIEWCELAPEIVRSLAQTQPDVAARIERGVRAIVGSVSSAPIIELRCALAIRFGRQRRRSARTWRCWIVPAVLWPERDRVPRRKGGAGAMPRLLLRLSYSVRIQLPCSIERHEWAAHPFRGKRAFRE